MKRTIALIIVCVLGLSLLFTGCGKTQEAATTTTEQVSTQTAVATAAPEVKPAKIKFMHWLEYFKEENLKTFLDENPNIQVELDYTAPGDAYINKIKALSATNELPDIFLLQGPSYQDFIKQGLVMSLDDALKAPAYDKETPWGETIQASLMQSLKDSQPTDFKEKTYAVPFGAISVACVYNKNIYDKVGITPPKTWDEFISNCDKLKAAGYIPLSFNGKIGWGEWWLQMALDQYVRVSTADFDAGKAKFTDPSYVKALATVQDMWKRGVFDPGGFTNGVEETQALFVQGKLAQYYVVPENFLTSILTSMPADVKVDAFAVPAMAGVTPARGLGGAPNSVMLKESTTEKDATVRFAKYMVSEKLFKSLAAVNVVPSTVGYTPPADNAIMKAFADASSGGFLTGNWPTDESGKLYNKVVKEIYPKLMLKGMAPEAAAKEIQDFYDKEIKK
jgi:raffinose/stachyose/melibiose transport system substrate-binding protein